MPWPVSQPAEIANRAAAVYAATYPDFNPTAANTVAATTCRVIGMTGFDLYGYQGYIAQELFPDTSQDNLDRHAGIWGLTRIPSQAAVGAATALGANGTPVPGGTIATDPLGNAYLTTATVDVASGTVTATFQAASAGAQGNLATGTTLTLLTTVPGLSPQIFTVASPGFAGGAPAESNDALRARVLQRIRRRGRGGNNDDYTQWCEAASSSVAYVSVLPNYYGLGSVGIFLAGAGPVALTSPQVAVVQSYVAGVRPVTAQLYLASATIAPLNGIVHLVPDTAANRLAAANGFESWVVSTAEIGGTQFVDDMAAAIKAQLGGNGSFDIIAPASDVVCAAGTISAAGTLSFV